jgi:hypothetical protein
LDDQQREAHLEEDDEATINVLDAVSSAVSKDNSYADPSDRLQHPTSVLDSSTPFRNEGSDTSFVTSAAFTVADPMSHKEINASVPHADGKAAAAEREEEDEVFVPRDASSAPLPRITESDVLPYLNDDVVSYLWQRLQKVNYELSALTASNSSPV